MFRFSYITLIVAMATLAYLGASASAQRFAPGYCPTIAAQENFDKTRVSINTRL